MKKLLFWVAVLLLSGALIYVNLFATPPAGTVYTEPEKTAEHLEESGNVEAYVDSFTEEDHRFCLFKISGWAYQATGTLAANREVYLVFEPLKEGGEQYTVSCGTLKNRPDVAERTDGIAGPNPATVGFDDVVFSAKGMARGTYLVYLRVVEDGRGDSIKTTWVLERTEGGATVSSDT